MPVIRVPIEAKPLLRLCRKHELGPSEQPGPQCFETYADLMVFAAAYGFSELNGHAPIRKKSEFLERPNPIDLSVFKNDRRYPQLLLIALATSKDQNVVRDEELICHLVEDYASVGCFRLSKATDQAFAPSAHLLLAQTLAEQPSDAGEIQI
jgi:dnd system-associated protein 4